MATATLTEATPATSPEPGEAPPLVLHRFTLEEYRKLGEFGLLQPSDKVVLLDGLLVKKMTKGARHVCTTHQILMHLAGLLPVGWFPRQEAPVEISGGPHGDSAPEPDVSVVAGKNSDYKARNTRPGDVRLLIQVADSTLATDRRGLARFARAGVPAVWIVNVARETIEVYTNPTVEGDAAKYADCQVKKVGETLTILLDGQAVGPVRVEDLLV